MRKNLRALAIALGMSLLLTAPAKAAIFNTSPLDMYPTTVPGASSAFVSNSISTPSTAFDDLWTFDISGSGSQGAANATALSSRFTGTSFDLQPLALQLKLLAWDGDGYDTVLADSGVSNNPFVQALLGTGVGGAAGHGFYALQVLGTTPANAAISQYAGNLQVAAVPEPSTYGLLAGGLLFVAWHVRRRANHA
jgi:hypothetical protein